MHPLKPYFLGHEPPPHHRLTTCQKCFRTRRHRRSSASTKRHITFFEMLGNFSIRRLLQAGRGRVRVGALARGLRLRPRPDLGHGLRGRRGARPRARRGGDRGVGGGRRPARAHRAATALGELLAGRLDRPVRAVLGALLRPRARVRRARTTSRAARTSASSSTGTSSSCSTTRSPGRPDPAAGAEHRHRARARAPGASSQDTDSVYETDNFWPLIELGEQLSGRTYGQDVGHRPRAAHPRRPHARDVVPDRRRRRALQRGPRLRAAPPDAAGDPAGPADRDRAAASCRASPPSCAS